MAITNYDKWLRQINSPMRRQLTLNQLILLVKNRPNRRKKAKIKIREVESLSSNARVEAPNGVFVVETA